MRFSFKNCRIFGLGFVLVLLLAALLTACSGSSSPSTSAPAVSTAPSSTSSPSASSANPNIPSRQGAIGTIAAINGNSLTLSTTQGGQVIVSVGNETAIEKTVTGSQADFQQGQFLTVVGTQDTNGNIAATSITIRPQEPQVGVSPSYTPSGTRGNRPGNGISGFSGGNAFAGGGTIGTLSAINGNALTVSTFQGNQVTVNIDTSTSIEMIVSGTVSDLKQGELLTVVGPDDSNGNIAASTISIQPANRILPPASAVSPTPTPGIPQLTNVAPSPTSTPTPVTSPVNNGSPSSSPAASPLPSSPSGLTPIISIIAPFYNSLFAPGDVTVTIVASNFNIVNKIGQPDAVGEGHVIYYLDATPPTTAGQSAVTSAGTFAEVAANSYTWTNVQPGTHSLSVQLVNNDGTPLDSPAIDTEPIQVQLPATTSAAP